MENKKEAIDKLVNYVPKLINSDDKDELKEVLILIQGIQKEEIDTFEVVNKMINYIPRLDQTEDKKEIKEVLLLIKGLSTNEQIDFKSLIKRGGSGPGHRKAKPPIEP